VASVSWRLPQHYFCDEQRTNPDEERAEPSVRANATVWLTFNVRQSKMTPIKQTYHPSWKVAVAVAAPLLVASGVLGFFIAPTSTDAYLNGALVIACSSVGWAFGMILSPDSTLEEKKFSTLWKGISLFISGYLVSKIDPLLDSALKPEAVSHLLEPLAAYRILAALTAIILTAILTYVVRVYAFSVGESHTA
jgi:hypothetical protein